MYAIIAAGGKQLRVSEGDIIRIERLDAAAEQAVQFPVLAMRSEDGFTVGEPVLESVRVVGRVLGHGRHKKVLAFRYKPKKNVRRRRGHRQPFTRVMIEKIEG